MRKLYSRFVRQFFKHYVKNQKPRNLNPIFTTNKASPLLIGINLYFLYSAYKIFQRLNFFKESEESTQSDVFFSDIIGIEEYKEEIQEIVDYLKNKTTYKKAGANVPKGILLYGKPGTGKTMLAKALANESGVSFFYKSGSEFQEKFVGSGSNKIKNLFEKARKEGPSIIFIDEIDSIGSKRDAQGFGGIDDAINQLLTEMDGFKKDESVIVVGATNRLDVLDEALLRPGRFDKVVNIPTPGKKSREKILSYYLDKVKVSDKEINRKDIVDRTEGFTGADIRNLVNLAALRAVEFDKDYITDTELRYALDRVMLGNKKEEEEEQGFRLRVAYTEAGMAAVTLKTGQGNMLNKLSLNKKPNKTGKSKLLSSDLPPIYTQRLISNRIQMLMGCRASEEVFYNKEDMSLRCGEQMKIATALGYRLVDDFGFEEELGIGNNGRMTSQKSKKESDGKVEKLLNRLYSNTVKIVVDNKTAIQNLALELYKKSTLSPKEIKAIINN